jgi:L-ascorbate metabolism protein UlaG (beta-lactamase superfamily)
MTITYFGHAALQIEHDGTTVLFDPFISGNPHAEGVVTADELEPDVIVLTHAHGDHWGDTAAIAKRSGALVVSNYEITQRLSGAEGHENVQPMNTGGSMSWDWGSLHSTFAAHSSSFPDGSYGGSPNGYVLQIGGRTVYHAGDTCYFDGMARLAERFDIDLAFLPVGDTVTMGPEEAAQVAGVIGAAVSVPVHWGTFPFLHGTPEDFASAMEKAGLDARILRPGDRMER